MDLKILKNLLRFPFVFEGGFYDSSIIEQNKFCTTKCSDKDCVVKMNLSTKSESFVCSNNFNCFVYVSEHNDKFMYNGLKVDEGVNTLKNISKGKTRLNKKELNFELARITTIEKVLNSIVGDRSPQFSFLHDIKTTFGLIQSQVELLINNEHGANFEEKLYHANQHLNDLYDSLGVVNSQLGMIDILVNPNKITHGTKRNVNLYKMFERMSKLFRSKARNRNITINWQAEEQVPNSMFYDAIEFLPVVLLDNAIKYSIKDKGVKVFFNLSPGQIQIKCSSFGYFIDDDEVETIFQKFKRGRNAAKTSEGMGIGLWILRQIIEAHGGIIYYEKEGSGNIGANNFVVNLRVTPPNKL